MAAEDEGKTEQPTGKKLSEARSDGNVAKSQDLSAATISLVGVIMIWFLGGWIRENIATCMYRFIREEVAECKVPHDKEIIPYLLIGLQYTFYILTPFLLIILVTALAVNIYQVGLHISTKSLKLDLNKLNPMKGMKNLFSKQKVVMLGLNILKVLLAFGVTYPLISVAFNESGLLAFLIPPAAAVYCVDSAIGVALRVALLLFILSLLDLWYQRHKFNESMKMTKEEVKDEMRSMEGDPLIKQKRRQKMMELARQRMMQEIPQAEVVVRNPTHYAVALSYKPEEGTPPKVVAKGKNKLAEKIIELAQAAKIPLWQDPWLARELYKIDLGDSIPPELFQAVITILTHVASAEKKMAWTNAKQSA